jgi:hypothetical protein
LASDKKLFRRELLPPLLIAFFNFIVHRYLQNTNVTPI